MSHRELKKLAKLLFQITRRAIWSGGRGDENWPDTIDARWKIDTTWTLSPEVELGGHRLRVCVSSRRDPYANLQSFSVRVFVDDVLKYPGGIYETWDWPWCESWAGRIARIERTDGGHPGPVDKRDLLITEAKQRLSGPAVRHIEQRPDPEAVKAVEEVEALVNKTRDAARRQLP